MKVLKFGGTSVGSAERMKQVANIVTCEEQSVLVLSAMSKTTNALLEICKHLRSGDKQSAEKEIKTLEDKYKNEVAELLKGSSEEENCKSKVADIFSSLYGYLPLEFKEIFDREIVAKGEMLSTNMMYHYMLGCGESVAFLYALDFMKKDENGEPDSDFISSRLTKYFSENSYKIYIIQGFICQNHLCEIDNLERGGSDYTASIIGAELGADEIQIWTDIDGLHNNDPRYVTGTKPVRQLLFDEAAELAYFGAKILHPICIQPAQEKGITVRLLNTLEPKAKGTIISDACNDMHAIKSIAAKESITSIKIKSGRMLLAYGFLKKIFEIFETYKTSIDMICTSEVGVSLTIDNTSHLTEITSELKKLGEITIDENMCIVCVVGNMNWENLGFQSKVIDSLKNIPIRLISYGGSNYNISILINQSDKERALQQLHANVFESDEQ